MPAPIPHLPADFLQKLKADPMMVDHESIIFSSEFQAVRLGIVDRHAEDHHGPDTLGKVQMPAGMNLPEAQDTALAQIHIAVIDADPLHLCEMIRLGADMDKEDSKGHTPLWLATQVFASYLMFMRAGIPFPGAGAPGSTPSIVNRLKFIVQTLIEQHVNVNHAVEGMTPLHWTCQAQDWDLIALLLKHGARPSLPGSKLAPPVNLLPSARDKSRFRTLAKSHSPDNPRPAQPCPCWSGKLLADCHAGDQPYPSAFYCTCGSKKTYGKCCSRRNIFIFEKWDTESRYIKHTNFRTAAPSILASVKGAEGKIESAKTTRDMVDAHYVSLPREFLDDGAMEPDEAWHFLQRIGVELLQRKLMEPAYAYAMKEVQFLPRPQGRSYSKHACQVAQERWNAAVDKFISLGVHGRSKEEIERAAKIGHSNGALYRKCEGVECGKLEGKDIDKLSYCSACKMSVYCSATCQSSAWKEHKKVCGRAEQREQALPSQIAVDRYLLSSSEVVDVTNLSSPAIEDFMHTSRPSGFT